MVFLVIYPCIIFVEIANNIKTCLYLEWYVTNHSQLVLMFYYSLEYRNIASIYIRLPPLDNTALSIICY